jgi:serine/threonine protein kinase
MSYCLNPTCQHPENLGDRNSCSSCGKSLLPLRDRYQIIRPLGGGGFGRTFLAEDRDKLNELCVVKQLVPQLQGTSAQNKATQLFEQEAKRLQQLGEHPQIPALYAYFKQDDYLYLVQQLIVGESLRQQLDQGAFNEQQIWELLADLLPVLQFIHDRQVIHRDIKPDNIMRRQSDRRLILIDFGVSKQFTTSDRTTLGTSIGSFGYASSEQMNEGDAYPASDLYSLGVTCFHLLTQISPSRLWTEYGYSWVKQWQQHLNVQISPELTAVLNKLLQKDIQQRYQNVEQVLQDLRAIPVFLAADITQLPSHVPIFAENTSSDRPSQNILATDTTLTPKARFAWRYKLLLGSAIFLVLGFAGYKYWHSQKPSTLMEHRGEVNTVVVSPDGKTIISGSDDRTIKIWDLSSQKLLRTLKGHTDWVYDIAISADSQTLVSGSRDKTIKIWNLSGQHRTLTGHTSYVNSVAISPDATKIVSGSYDKTVKLWNLSTGQVDTFKSHSREVLAVAISADGKKIVSGSVDRTLIIWNLKTLKAQSVLTGHTGDVNAIAISSDNQQIASVSDDRTIKLWNLNTGREIRTLSGHLADINAVDFSPDNQYIATGSDDRTVKIWDLMTGEAIYTFKGHQGAIFAVDYSSDGKTLVSASADKTIRKWLVPK